MAKHCRVEAAYGAQEYAKAYEIDTELSVSWNAKFAAEDLEGTLMFQSYVAADRAIKAASALCSAAEIRVTYAHKLVLLAFKCAHPSNLKNIAETTTHLAATTELRGETDKLLEFVCPNNEYTAAMAYEREAVKDQTESIALYKTAMEARTRLMSLTSAY